MRWLVTALAATLLMGVNGRIDVSRRGRLDVMLPASGINPITEQPHVVIGPPISGYHAETLDYIARVEAAGGGLTPTQESAIDTFVRSAHSGGWRDKTYYVLLFTGTNLDSALVPLFHGTNIAHYATVGTTNAISTGFTEGDFSDAGLNGDGSSYLDTGLPSNFITAAITNGWIGAHAASTNSHGDYRLIGAASIANVDAFGIWHYDSFECSGDYSLPGVATIAARSLEPFIGMAASAGDARIVRLGNTVTNLTDRTAAWQTEATLCVFRHCGIAGNYLNGTMCFAGAGIGITEDMARNILVAVTNLNAALGR